MSVVLLFVFSFTYFKLLNLTKTSLFAFGSNSNYIGSILNDSLYNFLVMIKEILTLYSPIFLTLNALSTKSPTLRDPKSSMFYVPSVGNFKSTLMSKASASIGISIEGLVRLRFSKSSATNLMRLLNFCC
jgi:hypothetical protein